MDPLVYLSSLLTKVVELKGQDLFLKVGTVPRVRIGSTVVVLPGGQEVKDEDTQQIIKKILNPHQAELLDKNKSVDFAFALQENNQRFRVNVFSQQGSYSLVIRTLWRSIPSFQDLKIPPVLQQVALEKSGIILIAGTVASGKTTTITAMLDMMNNTVERHIITIEDPVEYLHTDKKCIVNQREVGVDANDFNSALRYVVRQSPDVIMIGEMRDAETFRFAVSAAEVGRLVIATVHAKSVSQIIDRVLGFFPPDERDQALSQLSFNMTCFVTQKLIKMKDGKGLIPAFEILIGNYTTRQLLREKRFDKIPQTIRNASNEGMQTFDQAYFQLWKDDYITAEEAMASSDRPQEIENLMKGIKIDGVGGRILGS